ncbi:phage terminase large subunit [Chromobacterium violaceum]|uniref:phage terminase large subunit n=1 Tax=Chromobacterium violaceum TaxID=536 RepID=UPI0005B7FE08|nr:phage terminase large subunit [Chromobacterium violaceum]
MRQFTADERAAAILAAREDFYFFVRWMFLHRRKFQWKRARQHRIICDALMRVFRGECKRLIINIPPRYSKTELAVVMFIAWAMGKHPDSEFIHTCYSGKLAIKNSAEIREIIRDPAYLEIFPDVALRDDSQAKDEWRTKDGGVMYAVGSGGTITGYGAGKVREGFGGAIIIDDPHKADEARSDTIRNGVIEWFQNTLESRCNSPHTPIICIMQRLHERDLAGWLASGGNGEEWEIIKLKALQDDGTALWPEKHSVERLLKMKEANPYTFAGQYQQEPSPGEGGTFKPGNIAIIDAVPAGTKWVRGWDFAATKPTPGKDPDWTAGGKLGITPDSRFVIGDIERMRGSPDEVERTLKNTAGRDGKSVKISIPQDPGQAGKSQVAAFTRLLAGHAVTSSPESGDKVTRAEPFAAQCNVGNVMMLRASWNQDLIEEMRMFPNGAHDDQVDALSRAFNELFTGNTGLLDYYAEQAQELSSTSS